ADLEPLLLPVRQAARDPAAHRAEPDDAQNLADARLLGGSLAPQQRLARLPLALQRKPQIVLDGVHLEHGRLLEFTADTELGDLRLVQRGEVERAVEKDIALV